jgi:hypothetical protein
MATENETALIDLTPAQLESWKRDGFLCIKAQDFWTPQQIENLKKVPVLTTPSITHFSHYLFNLFQLVSSRAPFITFCSGRALYHSFWICFRFFTQILEIISSCSAISIFSFSPLIFDSHSNWITGATSNVLTS